VSIPLQQRRDKAARIDLLVVADPVWETSWLVRRLPVERFDPASAIRRIEDGGGSALNSACALACAGRRVVVIGRAGDDPAGHASVAALKRRGIEARIELITGKATKCNALYVEASSAATAFQAIVTRVSPKISEKDPPGLLDASWLLLDRLPARAPEWCRMRRAAGLGNALSRYGHGHGGPVARRYEETLPFLDVLQLPEGETGPRKTPGLGEGGIDRTVIHRPTAPAPLTPAEVERILQAGVDLLVRTRGERGVIVHSRGGERIVVPARPTKLLDPTGAGDALTAGILDALLSAAPLPEAVQHGLDWAARACRHLGARGWLDVEPPAGA
jgi:sugar/nucleoside kinase (ribokinase family)